MEGYGRPKQLCQHSMYCTITVLLNSSFIPDTSDLSELVTVDLVWSEITARYRQKKNNYKLIWHYIIK